MTSTDTTAAERMRRYRARQRSAGLVEQHRWVPRVETATWSDHRISEIRSLAMHALIARKLLRDPQVVERARANLDRWAANEASPDSWVQEWRVILQRPADQIAAFLVSVTEDAFRLRQSSPFAGALSPEERAALFDVFRERP